jgi:biopolymer transport protein ExbB/TolQ
MNEIVHDSIMQIIQIIIGVLIPILIGYIVALFRAKLGNERFNRLKNYADIGIKQIESLMGSGNGAQKKREVELWLSQKIKAKPDDISKIIDALVLEMNQSLKKEINKEE